MTDSMETKPLSINLASLDKMPSDAKLLDLTAKAMDTEVLQDHKEKKITGRELVQVLQGASKEKKGFMSSLDYLSPGRRKIAQLGWLGIWGGLGASAILSLFQGFKKGFSEPISNTVTLVGTVLQEVADYKNSLLRKIFGLVKSALTRK